MNKLALVILLFPLSLLADTTGNLLNQNFTNSSWSGTNKSSRHDSGTIAGVDGKYVESTISLSDTLTESQINNGWTSTLGADIWHWNNLNSTTTMKQTITNADGTVTTQIREVANTGCGSINCGGYTTYTDSYTQGINQQSDYDIAVRFTFDESSSSSSHYATDLKNPTLTIIHSLITAEQATTLSEISETVDTIIETEVETIEFEPLEEIVFEVFEEPIMDIIWEEVYFETVATEEINTGVVDIFFETIEPEEFTELIEVPMETVYEPETVEPEIETVEVNEEVEEVIDDTQIEQEVATETEVEETVTVNDEVVNEETEAGTETIAATETSPDPERGVEETVVAEDSPGETNAPVSLDIKHIAEQVAGKIKAIDKQLQAVQLIVAKAMQNNDIISSYSNVNYEDTIRLDGGNVDEYIQREYIDNRNIYAEVQISYNDPVQKYQRILQESIDNRIRAEEHLRSIRGY